MEYAIIKTGGKQYKVSEGDTLVIEKLPVDKGGAYVFEEVVAYSDGDDLTLGAPTVTGITVSAVVVEHLRGEKISVRKFKAKSHYRRQTGHRQALTKVSISSIKGGTKKKSAEPVKKAVVKNASSKPTSATTTKKSPRTSSRKKSS